MILNKNKRVVAISMVLSMLFVACAPSQKVIDNILPEYNRRIYSIADLIPYSYKELRNAQALYGTELTKFSMTIPLQLQRQKG